MATSPAFQKHLEDLSQEIVRLKAVEREYHVTIRVLGVVVERVLVLTHGSSLTITDEALHDAPDVNAYRNAPARAVVISVSRQ